MKNIIKHLLILGLLTSTTNLFCSEKEEITYNHVIQVLISTIKNPSTNTHDHLINLLHILSENLPENYPSTNTSINLLNELNDFIKAQIQSTNSDLNPDTKDLMKKISEKIKTIFHLDENSKEID